MQLIISNPLGWWGLLMVPALVLIHCLHRKRQPLIISTLFLVKRGSTERTGGRKFVFWKHSITFWLQILAALLITWLLLQPRWIGEQTQQQVAFVLDSSLSMDAFKQNLRAALRTHSEELATSASYTDWLLMESDLRAPVLYRGADRKALLLAMDRWQPERGTHDWTKAMDLARALVGPEGAVIFVTDHPLDKNERPMAILSVGEPLDNAGFTGLEVGMHAGEAVWRTLVRNYSDHAIEREWWLEIEGKPTEPRTVTVPPNGALALAGVMPPGGKALTLVLEDDRWPLDNRLPLVWPEPKRIAYLVNTEDEDQTQTLRNLLKSLGETYRGTLNGRTDLLITESATLQPAANDIPRQIIFAPPPKELVIPDGIISAEEHPLNRGLNWNSLTINGGTLPYELGAGETPLVWQGRTPLIWTRETNNSRDLVFNFSLRNSNALKLPATVLLIGRFVEQLREEKSGFEARNFELGERVVVSLPADAEAVKVNGETVDADGRLILTAPTRPGPLNVTVAGETLLRGSSHFADVREADLRGAKAYSNVDEVQRNLIEMNSEESAYESGWILLLAGIMLAGWHYAERGR